MVVQSLKDDICGRGTYDTQDTDIRSYEWIHQWW